jgi:protein required for attachment to host cells
MGATWIISANASRARFFSQTNSSDSLVEVHDMINDAGRLRMLETTESDKRGPTAGTKSMHNTGGAVPNKLYEPPQTPDVRENELFARDIAGFLEHAQQEGSFQQLCLVASPQFLGMLRKMLEPKFGSLITLELNKDYTQYSPAQLLEQVNAAKAQQREKPDT